MPRHKNLFKKTIAKQALFEAWKTVYASGIQSPNPEIKSSIENYSSNLYNNIEKLNYKLSRSLFSFSPVKGVLIKKQNGKRRPIGIASIDDRIVQRSILNTLLTVDKLSYAINNKSSFGGNKEGGVQKAISVLDEKIKNGAKFFIKTDIKNFFGSIPQEKALSSLFNLLPDDSINELLTNALRCELENAESIHIKPYIDMFPKDSIGVIQCCCLSPLLGNILLYDFDEEQQKRKTSCLRYIDDFIIIGEERQVFKSFDIACSTIHNLKLDIYTLYEKNTKAENGLLKKGVNFLGCFIQPGAIRPSNKAKSKLIGELNEKFNKSICEMNKNKQFDVKKYSYSAVLNYARMKIKGWADAYKFCTDKSYLQEIDKEIMKILYKYMSNSHQVIQIQPYDKKRYKLIGFQPLA